MEVEKTKKKKDRKTKGKKDRQLTHNSSIKQRSGGSGCRVMIFQSPPPLEDEKSLVLHSISKVAQSAPSKHVTSWAYLQQRTSLHTHTLTRTEHRHRHRKEHHQFNDDHGDEYNDDYHDDGGDDVLTVSRCGAPPRKGCQAKRGSLSAADTKLLTIDNDDHHWILMKMLMVIGSLSELKI